jgi:DNA modification methylase
MQLSLFEGVKQAYIHGPVSNDALYANLVTKGVLNNDELAAQQKVGRSGAAHRCTKRKVRWIQQSLKQIGILEQTGSRGRWQLTVKGKRELTPATPKKVLLGFSTYLGIALWGSCEDVFAKLDEPIALALTSPPYPLASPRAYGNPTEAQFVDWICRMLEPIVKNLLPGGSIVLNVSNDIFLSKSPARSLYRERMVIAMSERLGLYKMDEIIWHNPCKAPGPIAWASKERFQLNVAWEPVYWFTNDPLKVRSNNQRVLEPHSKQHTALMQSGGEKAARSNGDASQRIKVGAFSLETQGRIPRNLQTIPHNCVDQARYKQHAQRVGLPTHGAAMPLALARKLVGFLSEEDDLVVDPFGGSFTTPKACEQLRRRWISADLMGEYVAGSASRFEDAPGFEANFDLMYD